MKLLRTHWWVTTACIVVLSYAAVARFTPYPAYAYQLSAFGNGIQALLLGALSVALIRNGVTNHGKTRYFWLLLSLGSVLWFLATSTWICFEVVLKKDVPEPFAGDVLVFFQVIPIMAALAMRPHRIHSLRRLDFGTIDFAMLLLWWVYLYAFVVLPWQYIVPDAGKYGASFGVLYTIENAATVAGFLILSLRVRGAWRRTYCTGLLATAIYTVGSQWANAAIAQQKYYSGSLYDLPIVLSICVFLFMAFDGRERNYQPAPGAVTRIETAFVARISMTSVLSLPVIAGCGTFWSRVPDVICSFRLKVTGVALLILPLCLFLKQYLLDRELVRLLGTSQKNLGNLKRLQAQLVQSEKLRSLGELVAGAAHEISNPLTAIIGYSDLLEHRFADDDERGAWVRKIGQQARRTQELLKQMLKFSKQEAPDKVMTEVNRVVSAAVELRMLDLEDDDSIRILQRLHPELPQLWADGNQLLQVFFHIIGNAIDAMKVVGGGTLTITTRSDGTGVTVEFADTGSGVSDPQRIFDPFYTTKPVGKGAGLGLSAAYGIVAEHGGTIVCHNRPEGGATFLVRLPVTGSPVQTESTRAALA